MYKIIAILLLFLWQFSFGQITRTINSSKIYIIECPKAYGNVDKPYLPFTIGNKKDIINNETVKGKIVLINFWFEGCHPCLAEMASLNELYKTLQSNKDFIFLSITFDDAKTIAGVQKRFGLLFPVYALSHKECDRLNYGCGYPTTIILDKNGIIQYNHSGGPIDVDEANKYVTTVLLPKIRSLL